MSSENSPDEIQTSFDLFDGTWRPAWKMAFGTSPQQEDFFTPLSGSAMYLSITIISGYFLRLLNRFLLHPRVSEYTGDFLATMEMCAYFFENNFIFAHHGPIYLFFAVVVECFIANRTFLGHSENPVKAFYQMCRREIGIRKAFAKICIQTLAGIASYRYARLVWSLDFVPDHRGRYKETTCTTDLNVALFIGMAIEMGATLVDTWLGLQTILKRSLFDEIIKLSTGALMVVLGISTTGMYFNPAMATGHMLGCQGTTTHEHVVVYWLGPFVGCLFAIILDRAIHIDVSAIPRATKVNKDTKKKR